MKIYSWTKSLCASCTQPIDAQIVEIEDKVYLNKFCPEHGHQRALICSDSKWYQDSLRYVKPGTNPQHRNVSRSGNCADDCGLCSNHQQHTCLPVVEISDACNMSCPICLKDFREPFSLTVSAFEGIVDNLIRCEGSVSVLNISGGEPLIYPEIVDFLKVATQKGVLQTTISTNGLQLLRDSQLVNALQNHDALVALQFDGFRPQTYQALRGEDVLAQKKQIIELLDSAGISYSLVATIAGGVNDDEVADLCDFFFESNAHSIMFQPVTYTGQAQRGARPMERITIPDVIAQLDNSKYVNTSQFNPLPCSHPSCFALSYYFKLEDNHFMSMREFLGEKEYLNVIANRTLPGLDASGYEQIKNRVYDMWSAGDSFSSNEMVLRRIKKILRELSTKGFSPRSAFDIGRKTMKAIFIHQFMDVHTFDFGRLMKCCNHYPQSDNRLIPMCGFNVLHQGASL